MVMLPLVLASLMAAATLAGIIDTRDQSSCGTRDLSLEERNFWKRQETQDAPDNNEEINLNAVSHLFCSSQNKCPMV